MVVDFGVGGHALTTADEHAVAHGEIIDVNVDDPLPLETMRRRRSQ